MLGVIFRGWNLGSYFCPILSIDFLIVIGLLHLHLIKFFLSLVLGSCLLFFKIVEKLNREMMHLLLRNHSQRLFSSIYKVLIVNFFSKISILSNILKQLYSLIFRHLFSSNRGHHLRPQFLNLLVDLILLLIIKPNHLIIGLYRCLKIFLALLHLPHIHETLFIFLLGWRLRRFRCYLSGQSRLPFLFFSLLEPVLQVFFLLGFATKKMNRKS